MKRPLVIFMAMSLALLVSCHKDPPKTYDDTDMTITYYNTDFNFASYTTFYLPDSASLKTNYLTESQVAKFYEADGVSDQALDLLLDRFTAMQYVLVNSVDEADFIAVPTLTLMKSDETVWYNPGWWWGYPGYGWGIGIGIGFKDTEYWDWWYPWYPWYPQGYPVNVSTYTGTVIYEMLDAASYREVMEWNTNNPDPQPEDDPPQLEINWQALIEGYTTDDGAYNKDRAKLGTDEAFLQSPYLGK